MPSVYNHLPPHHFLHAPHEMSQQIFNHYCKLSCDHLLSKGRELFGSRATLEWCRTGAGFIRQIRLPLPRSDGFEPAGETLSFDELSVFSVPLRTLSPVPLAPASFLSTGHLSVFESGIRIKPVSANAAWTFAAGDSLLHRCLSTIPRSDNDSMPISFGTTVQDIFSGVRMHRMKEKLDCVPGGFNNRCRVQRQQRPGGSNFHRTPGPQSIGGNTMGISTIVSISNRPGKRNRDNK